MHETINSFWEKKVQDDELVKIRNQQLRKLSHENEIKKDSILSRINAVFEAQEVSTKCDSVYEIKETGLLPLGELSVADEAGRNYGFAKIQTYSDTDRVETEIPRKGLLKRKDIETTYVPKNVSRFGIVLYAADKEGANPEKFSVALWSTAFRPEEAAENLKYLDTYLSEIENALSLDT